MTLGLDGMNRSMELLKQYGVLDNVLNDSRSIDEIVTYSDFMDALQKLDLSNSSSSATSRGLNETSLLEALDVINNGIKIAINEIAPNFSDALTLDFVSEEYGVLNIGGVVIDPKTFEGALIVRALNAEARGDDVNTINNDIENILINSFGDQIEIVDNESRGLHTLGTRKWSNGLIRYYFDSSVSGDMKVAVTDAMKDWNIKTSRKIQFSEVSSDYSRYSYALGTLFFGGLMKITEEDLGEYVGGRTLGVGCVGSLTTMTLNPRILNSSYYRERTTRHELGHIIGLQHEHQRPDRDSFITMPTHSWYDINQAKLPKNLDFYLPAMKKVKVNTWFGSFYIEVPYIRHVAQTFSYTPKAYDYLSIMHYAAPGLNAKVAKQGYSIGMQISGAYIISDLDVQTVKSMY